MKPKASLLPFLAIAGSSLLTISSASAQGPYYWDGNNDASGFGAASGTWAAATAGTATSGWSTSSTGVTAVDGNSVSTTTTDSLNFGTNTALFGLAAGTINVSGTVNAGSITFGSQSGTITLSGGTINLANTATINTNNGIDVIDSLITGASASLTKGGGGTLRLTNVANTYTGATLIGQSTGGALEATFLADGGVASSIGASSSAAGNLVLSNINAGVLRYIGATHASTDRLFTLGNQQGYAGGFEVTGTGTLNLTSTGSVAFSQANQVRVFSLGGTHTGQNILNARLIDNGTGALSFIKNGAGNWVLANNTNSYTGTTTLNAGTLSVSKMTDYGTDSPIGKGTNGAGIVFNGGTLNYTGSGDDTNRLIQVSGTNGTILNNGTGALNFTATGNFNVQGNASASRTLTLGGANGGTISGAIQNNTGAAPAVNLTKTGTGTWTLAGANTNTGATTISGGTLVLDYSAQNNSKLSDTAAMTAGAFSSTLDLSGGSHNEIVASTTLSNGAGLWITRTSGSSSVALNAIGRSNGQNALTLSANSIASTDQTNTNGILGGWATVGGNWAVNSTNGADGAIVGLSTYTTTVPTTGGDATANYQLTGGLTLTGNLTGNSLRLVNGADNDVLDMGSVGSRTLTPGSGHNAGILYVGGFNGNYTITGAGTVRSATANNTLNVNVHTGTLTVDALLNSGTSATVKYGSGTLVIGGNNTGTGPLWILDGTTRFTHNNAAGGTGGATTVQNGAALELANSVAIGTEALTITGTGRSNAGALRNVANNTSSYAGAITIGTGGARINSDSGGSLTITGGVTTSLFNNVTFGGAGNTTVSSTAISGGGNVIKDGTGTLTLSAANTYTDATTVSGGKLFVNNTTGSGTGSGNVTVANGGTLGGSGIISGNVTTQNGGTFAAGTSIESLATGSLNQQAGSTFAYEANNNAAANLAGDLTAVTGNLTFDLTNAAILTLTELGSGSWATTEKLTLISYTGAWNGGLFKYLGNNVTDDSSIVFSGYNWTFNYNDTVAGTNFTSDLTSGSFVTMTAVSAIPEPRTALLGAIGLIALLRRRR